jgi:long-chain acyl-CoA synthetase
LSEKPWLKNYPVKWNLDYPEISLYSYFMENTADYPDLVALVFFGSEITFSETHNRIDRMAAALAGLGVKKGDRVALMLPNCPQYVYTYYACMKIGAVVVQVNPLYTPSELEFIINDSEAKVFVGADAVFASFHAIRDKVKVEQVIVSRLLWTDVEGDNIWFDDLLEQSDPLSEAAVIDAKKDIAVFQYTGGTTGFPKAAMLTHYNLTSNVIQIREWLNDWIDRKFSGGVEQYYGLAILPFFHSYGMTCVMNTGLTLPAGQVLVPRFDIDAILELIKQYKPALLPAVPTVYIAIANHPDADKYNIDAIEVCNSGAAPMPVDIMARFEQRTGSKMLEGYGLSEASPVTHCNPLVGERKPGSIGMPYPDTDCRIVDLETGKEEVPFGEAGELIIRGPQVMKGYWNRPEETEETLRDGWLYTGDIARMDGDGYFYIVDRKKEMAIIGGYNVYPREIDEVLFEHPKVAEAVSIGLPDNYLGEVIKSYVVLREGEKATEEEIIEYTRQKLAKFKVPRSVEFRGELPKSVIGKVLRRVLLEEEKNKG